MMRPTTINPLCDKDLARMSPKDLVEVESTSVARLIRAYVCNVEGCCRCYSETLGYFFFISGKSRVQHTHALCPDDARPMYLEFTTTDDEQIWRCPECGAVEKI